MGFDPPGCACGAVASVAVGIAVAVTTPPRSSKSGSAGSGGASADAATAACINDIYEDMESAAQPAGWTAEKIVDRGTAEDVASKGLQDEFNQLCCWDRRG